VGVTMSGYFEKMFIKQHPTFSLSFYYIQQYVYIQILNMYNTDTEPPFALLT